MAGKHFGLTRASVLRGALATGAAATYMEGSSLVARAQKRPLTRLTIGSAPVESYASGFYAEEMGFFEEQGLDVDIQIFVSGGTITSAVIGGSLDLGSASTTSIASAHSRGLPLYFIAPNGFYQTASPTTIMVAKKDSPLSGAADLTGKTVAVATLKDIAQTAVMAWIDRAGGDSSKTKFVEIGNALMAPAILEGRVDAAFLGEPFLTQAKENLRIVGSAYDAIAPRFMIIGWFANTNWISSNPSIVRSFTAAIRKAAVWADSHPKETVPILAKYTKVSESVISRMNRSLFLPNLNPALIQPVIDLSAKYKTLASGFPAKEIIYPNLP